MSLTDENSITNNSTITIANAPVNPRLCHLKKWPHFQGYGFNLHAERAKTGQHIGKVDADSPAESAGLLEGDRIIEVNGVNISNENHQQVVKRIRNGLEAEGKFYDDEVVLLVLDNEADVYYREKNVIVKADFKEVLKLRTKQQSTDENNNNQSWEPLTNSDIKIQDQLSPVSSTTKLTDTTNTQQDTKSKLISNSLSSVSQKSTQSVHIDRSETENETENLRNASATSLSIEHSQQSKKELISSASNLSVSSNNQSNSSKATTPNIQTKNDHETTDTPVEKSIPVVDMLYEQNSIDRRSLTHKNKANVKTVDPFQMSASEFKSYLKSKSRADPRIAQVDMRQKYQMFQDM